LFCNPIQCSSNMRKLIYSAYFLLLQQVDGSKESRRIFCPTDVCVFSLVCSTVPVSLSFLRLHSTVRRGYFVYSLAELVPLSQSCLIVCLWASSFALPSLRKKKHVNN